MIRPLLLAFLFLFGHVVPTKIKLVSHVMRKSYLVIPRLPHLKLITPYTVVAVSKTDRRLIYTGLFEGLNIQIKQVMWRVLNVETIV